VKNESLIAVGLIELRLMEAERGLQMVSTPKICRANGRKSRGPVTERGKAIASKNATSHGLLATRPPLLVTEDLSSFEGLVQGLIDQYQPESPVEHFLIQQVAMGMLKQYRLWSIEAASANIEILKARKQKKFPDLVTRPEIDLNALDQYREKRKPREDALAEEKKTLLGLIADFEYDLNRMPAQSKAKTLMAFRESTGQNYYHDDRLAAVWKDQDKLEKWLDDKPDLTEAKSRAENLIELARARINEIDQSITNLDTINKEIDQAEAASKTLQTPELFSRYERHITHQLNEALDRLAAIQQQRQ